MTATGQYNSATDGQDLGVAPAYPNVFGITFTPTITGALIALLGLAGAVYMFLNLVQPELERSQALQAEVDTKQTQANQQQANLKKIGEAKANLERAKQRRANVYSLFAEESSLNTMLLDLNREFTKPGREVSLNSFTPSGPATLVPDDSLGAGTANKLKSQSIGINMEGNFAQTTALARNIERLQPLIIFRNFNTTRDSSKQSLIVDRSGRTTESGEANLRTNMSLQVIVTPSPQPATATPPASPAPSPPAKIGSV